MSDRIAFKGSIAVEGRNIRGSVQLAGQRTYRNGEWLEVDPAALVKADAKDTVARFDHEPNKVLGRISNGTLSLERTDQGIEYVITNVPNTSYGNDALTLVDGQYVGGSSFEVEGMRSTFSTDPDGTRVRRITSIKRLVDVSPVFDPAYPSTAAAFSKETEVTAAIVPETPEVSAPPPAEPEPPKAKFTASEMSREAAEAFAKDQPTEAIVAFMDNVLAATKGNMSPAQLDQYEGFGNVLAERKRAEKANAERIERFQALHDMRLGRIPKAPEQSNFSGSDEYREAFTKYLRTGDSGHVEQFAQAIAGDGTQGGYTVPDGFLNRIVETLKSFGGIAAIADEITTTTGQPLRWPSNDDTGNSAAIAAEGVAGTAGADKVFGSVELGAYSYDATGTGNLPLLVSKELIQDAAFDIEAFIARNLATRLNRKMSADFATGSGSSEPKGLLDKTPDTMTATTMFAATIEHIFQVDAAYRDLGNCRWVLSDTTLAKAYASVDGNGRPLFIPQADASGAGRPGGFIQGYPITIDNGAGDLVAFGDMRLGYIVRRVRGVLIDVDPYTNIKTRQVAYHGWARADANIQDAAAYSVSDYTGVSADS